MEDLGRVDFDDEVKKRFKQVYVPNWFTVDLKTGVRKSIIELIIYDIWVSMGLCAWYICKWHI